MELSPILVSHCLQASNLNDMFALQETLESFVGRQHLRNKIRELKRLWWELQQKLLTYCLTLTKLASYKQQCEWAATVHGASAPTCWCNFPFPPQAPILDSSLITIGKSCFVFIMWQNCSSALLLTFIYLFFYNITITLEVIARAVILVILIQTSVRQLRYLSQISNLT